MTDARPDPDARLTSDAPNVPPGSFRFRALSPEEPEAAREERRQRLMALGQLASGLAHEIKNPLSTMKLNLQLMQADFSQPESERDRKTGRKLHILMEEVGRLEEILEDFLAFARGNELELELADVGKLVQEVADFVEAELHEHRITLWSGVRGATLPQIPVDRSKLKQALLNLIINARQAMTEGGGELFLTVWRDDGEVCVEVTDTGPGIPDDQQPRVFDVYYSTKRGGTGLGLPTVRRIVEEHGGRLVLQSEPGKGTQFLIRLPISRD